MSSGRRGFGAEITLLGIPVGLLAFLIGCVLCVALVFGQGEGAGACGSASASLGEVDGVEVPAELEGIYAAASERYDLGPEGPAILASVNWNETAFGTNMGQAPGAMGWMSFLPSSWTAFGLDGDGDGDRDPFDPVDAIFAAAHLLSITGAPEDLSAALFSYNHSDVYVADVLAEAEEIAGSAGSGQETLAGCSLAAGAPNEVIAAMVAEAERLSQRRPQSPYVYGGSHGITPAPANGPFDCSSAISRLLQVGGFELQTMTTVGFASWGEPGRGRWLTLHNKPYGSDAHIFIEFHPGVTPPSKRYWGTSGFVAPGQGPGWIPESAFSASYLAGFEERHPPGL